MYNLLRVVFLRVNRANLRKEREERGMSGGSFDYKCFAIREFAEELKEKIECKEDRYAPLTMDVLNEVQKSVEMAAELAHHVEWLYSGDHSEESFLKLVDATLEKYTDES